MRWTDFDAWLVKTVEEASDERRLAFARETVALLLGTHLDSKIDYGFELDDAARAAFQEARRCAFTASPARLRELLATVDAGILTDGSMDCVLLWMTVAIDEWAKYSETRDKEPLLVIAREHVGMVDWQFGTSLDDFLCNAPMMAERDRIRAALST